MSDNFLSAIYMMDGKKLEYKGEEALREIERLTMKADEVQESILKEILSQNRETEYLNKYMSGVIDITDIAEFKRCVPVTTYERIVSYIRRIANGEHSSLITGHPITEMLCRYIYIYIYICVGVFSHSSQLIIIKYYSHCVIIYMCSSGTSAGEPKMMPSIAEDLDRRTFVYNLILPIINQLNYFSSEPSLYLNFHFSFTRSYINIYAYMQTFVLA